MAIVVAGIVDDLDMREADEADDEEAEQRGQRELHGARSGRSAVRRERPKPCSSYLSFHPPPEGTSLTSVAGRSPGSRLVALPRLPEATPQWPLGRASRLQLRGQPRLWAKARTAFPLGPLGTDDERNYRGECKIAANQLTDKPDLADVAPALFPRRESSPPPVPAAATDVGRGCRALRGWRPYCAGSRRPSPNGRRPTPARRPPRRRREARHRSRPPRLIDEAERFERPRAPSIASASAA